MRISDWSSDVCSSDLVAVFEAHSDLLILMGDAALEAADQLDEESRSEAMAFAKAHECTVDHVKMTTPVCPCCHVRKRGCATAMTPIGGTGRSEERSVGKAC